MLTILIDGLGYGMVLFLLAVGLSVTMGLMNVVNLAHGAFAMLGGYVTVLAMQRAGLPFIAALPVAFAVPATVGWLAERTLYRHLYARPHLDQVLFSLGLIYMAMAAATYLMGSEQYLVTLPRWLQGRIEVAGVGIGRYRLFLVVVGLALAAAMQTVLSRSRNGARLRAAVDDGTVARGLGINVGRLFAATFAIGSGLAGLGGALGLELVGVEPGFPLRFMALFLIVVALGGTDSLTGPLVAALLVGVADTAGKYYLPAVGGFLIYLVMIAVLLWRPRGLLARAR